MELISSIIFIVFLYDIITFLQALIQDKSRNKNDLGEVCFEESIKYYTKLIHFCGLYLLLIITSASFYQYPLIFSVVFLIIGLLWLYSYFSRRLIITTNGIGYKDIFGSILNFESWDDVEFIHIEKMKIVAYLKSKQKRKYTIYLMKEELKEVEKCLPENIKFYIYRN